MLVVVDRDVHEVPHRDAERGSLAARSLMTQWANDGTDRLKRISRAMTAEAMPLPRRDRCVRRARRFATLAAVLLAGALSGCAMAPAQEMSDARVAVQAAREAGAERLSAQWLAAARGELSQAEQAIAAEHFDTARLRARIARGLALAARYEALLVAARSSANMGDDDARAKSAALVAASLKASGEGNFVEAARLADEAARIGAETVAASTTK